MLDGRAAVGAEGDSAECQVGRAVHVNGRQRRNGVADVAGERLAESGRTEVASVCAHAGESRRRVALGVRGRRWGGRVAMASVAWSRRVLDVQRAIDMGGRVGDVIPWASRRKVTKLAARVGDMGWWRRQRMACAASGLAPSDRRPRRAGVEPTRKCGTVAISIGALCRIAIPARVRVARLCHAREYDLRRKIGVDVPRIVEAGRHDVAFHAFDGAAEGASGQVGLVGANRYTGWIGRAVKVERRRGIRGAAMAGVARHGPELHDTVDMLFSMDDGEAGRHRFGVAQLATVACDVRGRWGQCMTRSANGLAAVDARPLGLDVGASHRA